MDPQPGKEGERDGRGEDGRGRVSESERGRGGEEREDEESRSRAERVDEQSMPANHMSKSFLLFSFSGGLS